MMQSFFYFCFCYCSVIICLFFVGICTLLFVQSLIYFISEILGFSVPAWLRRIVFKDDE